MTLTIRNASPADRDSCMALLESLASFTGGSTDPLAPTIFDQLLETTRGRFLLRRKTAAFLAWLRFLTISLCDMAASTVSSKN